MNMNIDGAIVTENIVAVLKNWQQCDDVPEMYVEKLCKLQDFFCRMLINDCPGIDNKTINEYLMDIINMKDDIKMFKIKTTDHDTKE